MSNNTMNKDCPIKRKPGRPKRQQTAEEARIRGDLAEVVDLMKDASKYLNALNAELHRLKAENDKLRAEIEELKAKSCEPNKWRDIVDVIKKTLDEEGN